MDAAKQFLEAVKYRVTSPVLGTFALWWLIFHWEGIYTTFFVSEDKIFQKTGLLKSEFVSNYFFSINSIDDWSFYFGIIFPAFIAYVYIWVLPKLLLLPAFKQFHAHKYDKKLVILDDERRLEAHRRRVLEESSKTLRAEKNAIKEEQEIIKLDPVKALDFEYEKFREHPGFDSFREIINAFYRYGGNVESYWDEEAKTWINPGVSSEALAIAHSNDLIEFANTSHTTIRLTEKGKHFVSTYPIIS